MFHLLAKVAETICKVGLLGVMFITAQLPWDPSQTKRVKTPMRPGALHSRLMTMFIEQRTEPREALALPLQLGDGCSAVTRNISASGMYLEITGMHPIKGFLFFEMQLSASRMKLTAEGEVVRVEHHDGNTCIAVKLRTPRIQTLD